VSRLSQKVASVGLATALIGASGCSNVQWKDDKYVREDRNRAMEVLLRGVEADPIRSCDAVLPGAIGSGQFSDDCLFDRCQETTILRKALALACACKTKLFAKSEIAPAKLNEIGNSTLADLVAVTNSLNQSPAVSVAAVVALRRRIPAAGADEISSLYLGGKEALASGNAPPARFKDRHVSCSLPPRNASESKSHKVTYKTILYGEDPTLRLMIENRTQTLLQAAADEQKAGERAAETAKEAARLEELANKAAVERQSRSAEIRTLLANAIALARKGNIDEAQETITRAKTIRLADDQALQGDDDTKLLAEMAAADTAVEASPAARRKEKQRQREEAQAKKLEEKESATSGVAGVTMDSAQTEGSGAEVNCNYQESSAPAMWPMQFEAIKVTAHGDEVAAAYTLAPRPWDRNLPHPFSIKLCALESALLTAGSSLLESHPNAKRLTILFDADFAKEDRYGNTVGLRRVQLVRFTVTRQVQGKLNSGRIREKGFFQGVRAMLRTIERVVHPWYHPVYIVQWDR
jgi:hypothetical protein